MARSRKTSEPTTQAREPRWERIDRPPSLTARVEQLLRRAIAQDKFPGGKLPTEVQLAQELGVSRETVRLATEALRKEGLLVKIRRRGTFLQPAQLPEEVRGSASELLGYLQADYRTPQGDQDEATQVTSALMLQGALQASVAAGYVLLVQQAAPTALGKVFRELHERQRLKGVIFASCGEEKVLRRSAGLGLATVLLDHDLAKCGAASVRDDSFQGARDAVRHLARLGHRRIALVNWRQIDLNYWRLEGYRQGLREAGLVRRRSWEMSVEVTEAGATQAVKQFLALSPRPTALYCFNNTLACLVIEELARCGLRAPVDVSVMGGGGEEVAGLTCHQADWTLMGQTAVRLLLQALAAGGGRVTPEHHLSPHKLRRGLTAGHPDADKKSHP